MRAGRKPRYPNTPDQAGEPGSIFEGLEARDVLILGLFLSGYNMTEIAGKLSYGQTHIYNCMQEIREHFGVDTNPELLHRIFGAPDEAILSKLDKCLAPRERLLTRLMLDGMDRDSIVEYLHSKKATTRAAIRSIFRKLSVSTHAELFLRAHVFHYQDVEAHQEAPGVMAPVFDRLKDDHDKRSLVGKIISGYSLARIAEEEDVSAKTIDSRLTSALKIIGVPTRAKLLRLSFGPAPDSVLEDLRARLQPEHAEVAFALLEGEDRKDIANQMGITENAVDYRFRTVRETIGVKSVTDLFHFAHGFLEEPSAPAEKPVARYREEGPSAPNTLRMG